MYKFIPIIILLFSSFLTSANAKDSELKLYVFECGRITVSDVSVFSPGHDQGVTKELTNSCYLVKHRKGMLIWDTGISDSIGPNGITIRDGIFHLRVPNPLASQLHRIGVKPNRIKYLALSHFHGDHTGNVSLFSKATLLIQKPEYEAAFGNDAPSYGFNPVSYETLKQNKKLVLSGDHDVFGDGTVIIKYAPGHTPGHQTLFINLPKTGPILLSGDLYHFTKNRKFRRVPGFNHDKNQTITSMNQIEEFLRKTRAKLWIQHDLEQNHSIRHAPSYYE